MMWHEFTGDDPRFVLLLEYVLESWRDTPYMAGQRCKKGGVDCVRFVCAVLDEITGTDHSVVTLPQDAALHARREAIRAMSRIRHLYSAATIRGLVVEPGDVIVMAPARGGPSHAAIVGPRLNTVWHATPGGVAQTSCEGILGCDFELNRIYRLKDRRTPWV